MRNKQRLLIMFLLIVMLFLYIVNNGHGLLYNHVIALEDEISFVAALVVLILSIPKAVDTFAKQSKIVKSISFISKVLALLIILMIPYLKDFVLLKKLMSVLDTNILLILILFFAYAGQWAAEIKRKDIKNRKENKEKGNSNEELPFSVFSFLFLRSFLFISAAHCPA